MKKEVAFFIKGIIIVVTIAQKLFFKSVLTERKTISTALYTFTGPYGNQYNYICAGVLITIAPILIFFRYSRNRYIAEWQQMLLAVKA